MKNRRLLGRRSPRRLVLFSSKGKAAVSRAAIGGAAEKAAPPANQHKIIDFATLASWYAEQNAAREAANDWEQPRMINAEKQKNLRFLLL